MTTSAWILGLLLLATCLAWMLRRKLRSDGIYQNGRYVGSALLAQLGAPTVQQAQFAIIRGEPDFRPEAPFEHRGLIFEITATGRFDNSSSVLRRFLDVTCRVLTRIS